MTVPPLALNQATTKRWTLAEAARGCVDAGITGIGLWRDRVQEIGVEKAARIVAEAGLTVTSLCRGGFFTAADWRDDNRRAVDVAAALGTRVLVIVCGGLPAGSTDLPGARGRARDAIGELAPYAAQRGVTLAIEPMHPMFCADRGVISTLGQALDIAAQFPADAVGVVIDTYHVWWDPYVDAEIARAAGRIALVQVADWVTPLAADVLLSRGHAGDGHVDIRRLVEATLAAGYDGYIEVEIFNSDVWAAPGEETLRTMLDRHRRIFT